MIKWTVLGSASGIPSGERNSSGHVLDLNGDLILFDCGGGVASAFLRAGFDPTRLAAIFISHMHPDHCSDLPLLMQKLYHTRRERSIDIFVPDEAVIPVGRFFDACYLFQEKFPFRANLLAVEDEHRPAGGRVIVRSFLNGHLEGNARLIADYGYTNRMQCYSFLIEGDGKKIYYSSDLASLDDIHPAPDDLDLLILETTHIDLTVLPELISGKKVRKTILTHIADEDESRIREFVADLSGKADITAASDGYTSEL
nr:MBL fold metallo-hydrolase [candidate division Zixibacteria bacterium]